VAEDMSNMMEEYGMTLEGVKHQFSTLAAAAKESGFGTKRFFSMVLQATSGMSMYNVRLEETAALLTQLGKVLGQKEAAQALQGMGRPFAGMSVQERGKKAIVGDMSALRLEALEAVRTITKKIDELGPENAAKVWAVLEQKGLKKGTPKEMAQSLSLFTPQQIQDLTFAISGISDVPKDVRDGIARAMSDTWSATQALTGTVGGMAEALRRLGATGGILVQLMSTVKVMGKRLDQIDPKDWAAAIAGENISGVSPEQKQQMILLAGRVSALSRAVTAAQKGGPGAIEEFNKSYAKDFGVMLTKEGKLFRRDITYNERGEEQFTPTEAVNERNFGELLYAITAATTPADQVQEDEDRRIAKDIAQRTSSVLDVLERGITYILEEIRDAVVWIADHLPGGGGFKPTTAQRRAWAAQQKRREEDQARQEEALQLQVGQPPAKGAPAPLKISPKDKLGLLTKSLAAAGVSDAAGLAAALTQPGIPEDDLRRKFGGELMGKVIAEKIPEELMTKAERDLLTRLQTSGGVGVSAAAPMGSRLGGSVSVVTSTTTPSPEQTQRGLDAFGAALGTQGIDPAPVLSAPAHDFLMQNGRFQRIDSADVVTGAKAGGPLSRAVGGGGEVHNYHFYNDGPGNYRTLVNARKAGALRR
jgi:hypothetical protein